MEIPMVIYVSPDLIHVLDHHISVHISPSQTHIKLIPLAKHIYESSYAFLIAKNLHLLNLPKDRLPPKDTIEYMFTMCYKTEFVRKAIQLNNYNASQFIWLDLGIKHMMDISEEEFAKKVLRLQYLEYPIHIRIATIWNPDYNYDIDLYKDICWCFAGSIFGGNIKSLLEFADLTKETSLKIINEKKSLMWEINVWKIIYNMDRWKFLYYTCSHDNSIIDNY